MTIVTATEGVVIALNRRRLDVGAGKTRDDGWETMDVSPAYSPDFQHDITRLPWPFDDETFSELRCQHVLEHLERKHLIPVMNEMHRITMPGGSVEIEVPVFPYWTAIADPTHLQFFVPQTFAYFCTSDSYRKAVHGARNMYDYADQRELYGIREWEMVKAWRDEVGSLLRVRLAKI